ncbi:MAG: hypothetical protein VX668_01095, partial [Planctomycetota bacterium]|nr:hypothetical protein [Planctomycetota bacterium]
HTTDNWHLLTLEVAPARVQSPRQLTNRISGTEKRTEARWRGGETERRRDVEAARRRGLERLLETMNAPTTL